MKAEIWELHLSYSPIDLLFGKYEIIKELYIPLLNYSFNFTYDTVNLIKYDENRYKYNSYCLYQNVKPVLIKTIDLDAEQIALYKNLISKSHTMGIHNFELSPSNGVSK